MILAPSAKFLSKLALVFFEMPETAFTALEGFFGLYSPPAHDLMPCDQGALIVDDLARLR